MAGDFHVRVASNGSQRFVAAILSVRLCRATVKMSKNETCS